MTLFIKKMRKKYYLDLTQVYEIIVTVIDAKNFMLVSASIPFKRICPLNIIV